MRRAGAAWPDDGRPPIKLSVDARPRIGLPSSRGSESRPFSLRPLSDEYATELWVRVIGDVVLVSVTSGDTRPSSMHAMAAP